MDKKVLKVDFRFFFNTNVLKKKRLNYLIAFNTTVLLVSVCRQNSGSQSNLVCVKYRISLIKRHVKIKHAKIKFLVQRLFEGGVYLVREI